MTQMCANEITISGPTDTIEKLWDDAQKDNAPNEALDGQLRYAKDVKGLLNAMVPMPEKIRDDEIEEWYMKNWGTLDVSVESIDVEFQYAASGDGTSTITGCFDTEWGPPIKAYQNFLKKNDKCSIEADYEKDDADFAGLFIDGDDQFFGGIHGYCKAVIEGSCALEDTPKLFQLLEKRLGLLERRYEEIKDEIGENEIRSFRAG
jgi:hypothetical protein